MRNFMSLVLLVWAANAFAEVPIHKDRNEAEYNNQYAVVLDGYDPVSYFEEGGAQPQMGDANLSFVYGTRIYHFANAENLEIFMSNPLKYEPSYGSWCAYAMAKNAKIIVQPLLYTISGNRLHTFASSIAKKKFDADVAGHELLADENWKVYSGEEPRK